MRQGAYRAILLLTPVALLLALEGGLRLWLGDGRPPLLVDLARSGQGLLRSTNAVFPRRYFHQVLAGAAEAGRMRAQPFVVEPGVQPYRVVFVGASTVQGYPHPLRLSASAFLQDMLADGLPGQKVQVFNLGITSIGSWAVARTVEAALPELSPDAVVVYTGHNEFYGIYGAGAAPLWRSRLGYTLQAWALPRALQRLLALARPGPAAPQQLLEAMARRGEVAVGDPRRRRAAAGLEGNLDDMARRCAEAGVRLVLCTLAANDEDFAPAGSSAPDSLGAAGRRWHAWVSRAARASTADSVDSAAAATILTWLDSARALSPGHAWPTYLRGRALRALGRHGPADSALARARELDTMPWRAPEAHNLVVQRVAARHGLEIADVASAFRRAAAPRRPGWTLMADHVHPTVRGQLLLARTVAAVLLDGSAMARLGRDADYLRRQGNLPAEAVRVDQAMGELLSAPPMDRYHRAAGQRFRRRAAEGWRRLSLAEQRGARRWMGHRGEVPLALDIADELFRSARVDAALLHYRAARREAPFTPRGDLWAAVQIGWCASLGAARPDSVRAELAQALGRVPFVRQSPGVEPAFADFVSGSLQHFLGRHRPALAALRRAFADSTYRVGFAYSLFPLLAAELVRAGRADEARLLAGQTGGGAAYFRRLVESLEASP